MNKRKASWMNYTWVVLIHTLIQIKGSNEGVGKYAQIVPPFKETYSWEEPVIEKANTVYLELVPGKPDTIETVLYVNRIYKIKEFFVDSLKYKYVMVCRNEKRSSCCIGQRTSMDLA